MAAPRSEIRGRHITSSRAAPEGPRGASTPRTTRASPRDVPGHRPDRRGVAQPRAAVTRSRRAPGRALALDNQQVGRARVPQDVRRHSAHRRQRNHAAGEHVVRAGAVPHDNPTQTAA